jgi:hypothetical protein
MTDRPSRWIPLALAVMELLLVAAIMYFWRPKGGTIWWYVRGVPVVLLVYQAGVSLWDTFVTSDEKLNRRFRGDFKN